MSGSVALSRAPEWLPLKMSGLEELPSPGSHVSSGTPLKFVSPLLTPVPAWRHRRPKASRVFSSRKFERRENATVGGPEGGVKTASKACWRYEKGGRSTEERLGWQRRGALCFRFREPGSLRCWGNGG
jgi:hypothetical protein